MGYVIVHRREDGEDGRSRIMDSGMFDTEATDNPDWVTKALSGAEDDEDDEDSVSIPPKGGAGSGVKEWAQYAEAHDVALTEGMTRDQIIAACEAANVPTE